MIDIENEVLNTVTNALRAVYGDDISIYGEAIEVPEQFPCVTLVEKDNSEIGENKTLTRQPERASVLMYESNVYTNRASTKKSQAKAIMDMVDEQMRNFGFRRTMRDQLSNIDRTVYRVTSRYTKVIQIF